MGITIIRSVIIYIFVIIAVRIMGKRQLGELSNHEFVITILISAVATIPLEENAIPLSNSLLPILIFISLEIIESAVSMKSQAFSRLLEGKPVFIIKNGRLLQREMKRLRISVADIIDNLRSQGIFSVDEVKNAVVEANGKLSVQKTDDSSEFNVPIIIDGKIIKQYFGGTEEFKGCEILIAKSGESPENTLLMTVDSSGKINIIKKEKE